MRLWLISTGLFALGAGRVPGVPARSIPVLSFAPLATVRRAAALQREGLPADRRSVLPLTALLWILARARAQSDSLARAVDALPVSVQAVRPVALGELRANPGKHLGEEVRFTLQFRRTVEDWDPFLSRFDPARWLGFEAWPDESFLWEKAVFENPAARLFVRRGGGFEPLVRRARGHARFEARALVRESFLGEPWLEVLELVPLEGEVGDGTILHMSRARELVYTGQFDLALEQYERARSAPLPPHALAAILGEILETKDARDQAALERGKKPAAGSEGESAAHGAGAPRALRPPGK